MIFSSKTDREVNHSLLLTVSYRMYSTAEFCKLIFLSLVILLDIGNINFNSISGLGRYFRCFNFFMQVSKPISVIQVLIALVRNLRITLKT